MRGCLHMLAATVRQAFGDTTTFLGRGDKVCARSSPEEPTAALRGECGHLRGCPRWDSGNLATPWDLPTFRDLQSVDLKAVMRACWGQLEGRCAWDITRSDVMLRELLRCYGGARRKAQAHAEPSSLCAWVCPCIRALSCANALLWFYFIYFLWLKNKLKKKKM